MQKDPEILRGTCGDDTLDTYLKKMDLMTFASVDKVLLCEILIQKGMYAMALEIISVTDTKESVRKA